MLHCDCGSNSFTIPVRGKIKLTFKGRWKGIKIDEMNVAFPDVFSPYREVVITCTNCNKPYSIDLETQMDLNESIDEFLDSTRI